MNFAVTKKLFTCVQDSPDNKKLLSHVCDPRRKHEIRKSESLAYFSKRALSVLPGQAPSAC